MALQFQKVFGNNTDAFLDSLLAESDVSKLGCFTSELEEVTATISDTSSDSGRLVGDHSNHVMLSTQPEEDSTSSNGSNSPQHTPEGFEVVTQSGEGIERFSLSSENFTTSPVLAVPESLRPIQVVTVPSGGTTTVTPIRIAGPNKSVSVKQINPAARLATAATTTIMLPVMNIRQTKVRTWNDVTLHECATNLLLSQATVNTTSPPSKRRRISASSSSDSGLDDVSSITSEQNNNASNNKYPPLILNDEEKRLCEREGVRLPSHYPLSREEEKNLKRIRRKIRNKVSAQDSRKRKKEYVEAMESRVKKCEMEKDELHKKMELLEMQNKTLAGQVRRSDKIELYSFLGVRKLLYVLKVRRLHQIIVNGGGFRNSQASTAMMVLLLSTALFLIPGLKEQMRKYSLLGTCQPRAILTLRRVHRTLCTMVLRSCVVTFFFDHRI